MVVHHEVTHKMIQFRICALRLPDEKELLEMSEETTTGEVEAASQRPVWDGIKREGPV